MPENGFIMGPVAKEGEGRLVNPDIEKTPQEATVPGLPPEVLLVNA
jgi:hypothetical protein